MNKRWISHEEIARRLGISRPTVHAHLKKGCIPGREEFMGGFRVDRETFTAWADAHHPVRSVKSL